MRRVLHAMFHHIPNMPHRESVKRVWEVAILSQYFHSAVVSQ
jgi:hypothetical protein